MSEPETPTPWEPVELVLPAPLAGVAAVTLTSDPAERGCYVFDAKDAAGKTIVTAAVAEGDNPSLENAEGDISANLAGWTTTLEQHKQRKLAELAEACWAEYSATLVTSFGAPFHTTSEAILDVMNIIAMLAPGDVYQGYKGADDVWRDLTREQFELALQEGAARKSAAFAKRKTLTDQVEAATTQAELDAISWQS